MDPRALQRTAEGRRGGGDRGRGRRRRRLPARGAPAPARASRPLNGTFATTGRAGHALLAALRARVETTLRALIAPGTRCALLDFPSYANVGDSAIWLGGLAALRAVGGRVVYAADPVTYDAGRLRARLGAGTILLTGGGNFGDLWPSHQRFRERVVRDFPDRPIVQLPQTLHFGDAGALERARASLDRHPDLTLLVRDARSLELAGAAFRARSLLCPDLAFGLGAQPRVAPPVTDVVWLSRTDVESAIPAPADTGVEVTDWITDAPSALVSCHWLAARHPRLGRRLAPILSATYARVARARVARGRATLGRGRVIITDRLHGHVLALLLGIPHVLLDDRHGKLGAFHATWTRGCGLATWANSPREALGAARALLATGHAADGSPPG